MDTTRRLPAVLLALALAATTAAASPSAVSAAAPAAQASPATQATTVVVSAAVGGVEAAVQAVRAVGGTVLHRLPLVDGVGASLPAGTVLAPDLRVSANLPMRLSGSNDTGLAREASAVREALGLGPADGQGAGTTVAVVDTGVADVPDLSGRLRHLDVSGTWSPGEPRDGFGHGTFVAGAVAGDGSSSAGRYAGVAPGADVLDVRVADDDGSTDLVTVLAGLEALSDPALGVDVVNLSMSSGSPLPYQIDPLSVALSRLWASGITVVVPSGNEGPGTRSVTSPGSDPTLLTVGALDERFTADRRDDVVPAFSGRGPAPQGVAKPDLVAPGQSLVSLRAPGSGADLEHPGSVVAGSYFRGSGTSFATALVSGAVALLREEHGAVRPDQAKAVLSRTAYAAKGLKDRRDAGAGGLDLTAALSAALPDVPDAALDLPPAGDEQAWEDFVAAVEAGDRTAAAHSWSRISPAGHRWAANSWSANSWSANSWSGHRWAGADGTADVWQMRQWAGHRWAAHSWSGHRWAGHRWAGHRWAGHRWAGSRWADDTWAGSRWAGSRWAGSRWAGSWE